MEEPTPSAAATTAPAAAVPGAPESQTRRILVESALIVFSILLALAVNEWSESRRQNALTERALRAVGDEVAANAQRVRDALPYHKSLEAEARRADSLGVIHSYADFKRSAPDWSGFRNPELDATAWQSAITLGVVPKLGFDTVRALSHLYGLQSKLDQYATSSLSGFDFSDAAMSSTVRRMWVFVSSVRTNEDTLLDRYEAALRLLGRDSTR
jgi:type II secretory pathway pseudopilin PulG